MNFSAHWSSNSHYHDHQIYLLTFSLPVYKQTMLISANTDYENMYLLISWSLRSMYNHIIWIFHKYRYYNTVYWHSKAFSSHYIPEILITHYLTYFTSSLFTSLGEKSIWYSINFYFSYFIIGIDVLSIFWV